jgi:DNA-binding NtrC family response regulator
MRPEKVMATDERGPEDNPPIGQPRQPAAYQVLVVEDDPGSRRLVEAGLANREFAIATTASGEGALGLVAEQDFDVVLLDLVLPGMDGIETLRRIRTFPQPPEVVILTGHAEVDTAVAALKLGADDYLSKPFGLDELEQVLRKAADKRRLERDNIRLRTALARGQPLPPLVVASPAMRRVVETAEKAATSDCHLLVLGETGTGKEVVARTVHARSQRAPAPFVAVNCGALPAELLENELFGHERGAFTGAVASQPGLFEVADGGTLFLDEIGEMSPAMQVKLLRVLDGGEIRRLGGRRGIHVDTRTIAATHRDLEAEVRAGRFREDLFYRLNVVTITIPPLRGRPEDIPVLVDHYLAVAARAGAPRKKLTSEALACLATYAWPGNVRELRNVTERLALLCPHDLLGVSDLPPELFRRPGTAPQEAPPPQPRLAVADIEREHILRVLASCGGNKSRAAQLLGVDPKTLYNKMKRWKQE